jgi:hypothetical protein
MLDDINEGLKDENIEITASALTHPDDEAEADEIATDIPVVDPELDEFADEEDDELDGDKMDFEGEKPDLL